MLKVKVISLPYIFQILYVLCFTRSRYQVSFYKTIGPLGYDIVLSLSIMLNSTYIHTCTKDRKQSNLHFQNQSD